MSFPAAYQDPCAVPTFRARSGFRKSFAPRVGVLILGIAIAMLQASQPAANATVLVATNSVWAYRKGTSEASIPIDAWRRSDFNDSAWPRGRGPFYYDSGGVYSGNTELPDMRNQYTCVYLRTSFAGGGAPAPSAVRLRYFCDDGFALWINGLLVTNVNKSTGSFAFGSVAAAAVGEPLIWKELRIPNPADWWNAGANQIAVQAFNSSLSSSDFVMELELATEEPDTLPPRIVRVDPPPGAIGALTSVTVEFSEPVVGLGFSDLLVNDRPAVGIEGTGTTYRFAIEQPAYGEVRIGWDQGALIEDLAAPPNRLNPQGLGTGWTYQLVDSAAPTIVETSPPPGITVRSLRQIEVRFSEIVTGVDAADLLIDETPAVSVTGTGNGPYVFRFEGIPAGEVSVEWSETSGIRDLGEPPHPLPATKWSYTVDPAFAHPAIRISEVLAGTSGTAGLRDEDGETHDWIELENRGTVEANLEGWSLSDDPADPGKWVFPAVRLAPGRFVVVFASGKNRRPANTGTPLHTNFRLATRGEFLGLFTPETPRELAAGFEPAFPEQRNDYSYGSDGAGGMGYFERPTPGSANGSGSLTGLLPRVVFDVEPGWFDQAFTVHLACAVDGAVIRYTTDGSVPTIATGAAYTGGIEVQRTQVLRAAAFLAGWVASPTATRTYLFPADVIRQPANPPEVPAEWVDTSGRSWTADYGMDPEIVDSPAYRDRVLTSLRSLPAMSIVTRPSDMFDNARGIYPKSQARGPSWEREASVEILELDGGGSVQVDCGVQMQGNSVRDPVKTAKHAFRLVFKGDYGEPKLRYRVFPDSRLDEFDTLTLRADFNNSWMHWNGAQRPRGQRVRDAWMKDSQRAMGGLASHSRFFHLYVNGLYWGVYDATERPDAAFAAAYQGGAKEEYDVVNEGQLVDGTMAEYNTMR
ncbi:MAG: chitobiase/beta-hexosaminidase C-terminal domain-containing protein, partial [Limisphaerales bacterium]